MLQLIFLMQSIELQLYTKSIILYTQEKYACDLQDRICRK